MAVYVFSLLVGYYFGGVDYAQGARYKYLKKLSCPVKYVFTGIPNEREVSEYQKMGIETDDMISAHFLLSGNERIGGEGHIIKKPYYSKGHLVHQEYYTDRLLYADYYTYADENGEQKSKRIKRAFRNPDGTSAYDIIYDENGSERYLFPNGENLSKQEFLCRFIQKLNLTEEDVVLIDRPGNMEFVQPLFTHGNKAKIIVFLHSGHYARKGESDAYLYLNFEYYYWFKNSDKIHTVIVSTDGQKEELIEKLKEYGCKIPNVEVIQACGLETLFYPDVERKPYSLLTVSRLVTGKRISWIIRSVIEAHKVNPEISLDIYGEGNEQYVAELKQLVETNQAGAYIHFMGHRDVTKVYMGYEAYISASLWETLGLTLMEAVGSGTAMIGLDVKYGNKVFIQNEQNGYLTDLDFEQIKNEPYVESMIHDMAQNIIRLFESPAKLRAFHEKSYQIAEKFLNDSIEEKWHSFFEKVIKEDN